MWEHVKKRLAMCDIGVHLWLRACISLLTQLSEYLNIS